MHHIEYFSTGGERDKAMCEVCQYAAQLMGLLRSELRSLNYACDYIVLLGRNPLRGVQSNPSNPAWLRACDGSAPDPLCNHGLHILLYCPLAAFVFILLMPSSLHLVSMTFGTVIPTSSINIFLLLYSYTLAVIPWRSAHPG